MNLTKSIKVCSILCLWELWQGMAGWNAVEIGLSYLVISKWPWNHNYERISYGWLVYENCILSRIFWDTIHIILNTIWCNIYELLQKRVLSTYVVSAFRLKAKFVWSWFIVFSCEQILRFNISMGRSKILGLPDRIPRYHPF